MNFLLEDDVEPGLLPELALNLNAIASTSAAAPASPPPAAGSPDAEAEPETETESSTFPHPTINLLQSAPPPYLLQTNRFYASSFWLDLLTADVNELLDAFVAKWNKTHSDTDADGELSGFGVFKDVWKEMGWEYVHLLGVMDGPMRLNWAESVVRVFVDHLNETEHPLRQVAAVFALWTMYSIQPPTMQHFHIHLSPGALSYLLTLPSILDASTPPAITHDLQQVLLSLLDTPAFFLLPTETFRPHPLPNVTIVDSRRGVMEAEALKVLAAEAELQDMRRGKVTRIEDVDKRYRDAKRLFGIGSDEEEEEEEGNGDVVWNLVGLRERERTYLEAKGGTFRLSAEAGRRGVEGGRGNSGADGSTRKRKLQTGNGAKAGPSISRRSLKQELLATAERTTLERLQNAASKKAGAIPGAASLPLFAPSASTSAARSQLPPPHSNHLESHGLHLFNLVGDETSNSVTSRTGMQIFEEAMMELDELEMVNAEEEESAGLKDGEENGRDKRKKVTLTRGSGRGKGRGRARGKGKGKEGT